MFDQLNTPDKAEEELSSPAFDRPWSYARRSAPNHLVLYEHKHLTYKIELLINSMLRRWISTRENVAKAFDLLQIVTIHIWQAARPWNYDR
jgi:hypothetical protein